MALGFRIANIRMAGAKVASMREDDVRRWMSDDGLRIER